MARLQSAQTSPVSESPISFQAPIIPPLQARRRDSRESLLAKQQSDPTLNTTRRAATLPALSITIPAPDSKTREKKTKKDGDALPAADGQEVSPLTPDNDGDVTPREKTVSFEGLDDDEADEDDEAKSAQSSICQSPSWEGYGRNKKKKKLEAEQRKKEKELADQELKAKKKLLGQRLITKVPPSPAASDRPSTASTQRHESQKLSFSNSTRSVKSHKSNGSQQNFVPPWGFAVGAGGFVGGLKIHQAYSPSAVKAIMTSDAPHVDHVERPETESKSDTELSPRIDQGPDSRKPIRKSHSTVGDYLGLAAADKSDAGATTPNASSHTVSYPPQASRTHALRIAGTGGHSRSNSASAATLAKMEDASRFFKAQNMKSSQSAKLYSSANVSDESLQSSQRGRRDSGSYVRQSRAQSSDRSLSSYIAEVSISSMPQSPPQRPATSHTRILHPFSKHKDEPKANNSKDEQAGHGLASPTKAAQQKDGEAQSDYFNFVTKPYAPPALDLTPHAPNGLLTSIKSRISRRSSSASSGTQNARSFKDRAMGAMHMTSHPSSRAHSEANIPRSVPSSTPQTMQSPTFAPEEFARLPKAARVLGEINAETMQSTVLPAGSRPSEGSSTSSYHDDSSGPPSPASTPDTSRPQSARGLYVAIEEVQKQEPRLFFPSEEELSMVLTPQPPKEKSRESSSDSSRSSSKTPQAASCESREDIRPTSRGRLVETDRPAGKGWPLEDLARPKSKGRSLDDIERPGSKGRMLSGSDTPRPKSRGKLLDVGVGLEFGSDSWSRTAMPFDIDAQSFVTSPTHIDGPESMASLATTAKTETETGDHSRQASRHSRQSDDGTHTGEKDRERPPSRSSRKDKKSSTHSKQMSVVNEEPRLAEETAVAEAEQQQRLGDGSVDVSFLPPLKHEALPPKSKARSMTQNSAPAVLEPSRAQVSKMPFTSPPLPPIPPMTEPPSGRNTPSAAYLQEARRSAPHIPSPLSHNTGRPRANSAVTASRPVLMKSAISSPATVTASRPALPPPQKSLSAGAAQFRVPAQEPEQLARPMAKMLVECCSCHFFHDMPSRVYECMTSPDAVVTDRALGVSGAITTMVKCPWCSHNMSTACCAGYAALVYLRERLH